MKLTLLTFLLPATLLAEVSPSFRQDVMPILFRAGCNAGTCHGAAKGKDGFMLSLFGYDPAGDYHRIVNDIAGRRINPAMPERSLLLLKSLGKVPHTGGEIFSTESPYYRTLLDWRQNHPRPAPRLRPPERWLEARCHQPRDLPLEQSRRRHHRREWPRRCRRVWRHPRLRPLQPLRHRSQRHCAEGRQLCLAESHRAQLHRQAPL
jgi:hypothetical protein